jgi:cytochrome P450 family 9
LLSCVDTTEWDDDDITAQAVLFFLAGFDTASTLLCFASHQLAVHPDIQSRLQDEIDQTLEEDGGYLTYEALHGMKYLDMVVSGILQKLSYTTLPDYDQRFGLEFVIYHKITVL